MNSIATVEIEIQSTPEKIFQAWVEPELLARWMFGPSVREESIIHLNSDPRPGGLFSFLVLRNGIEIDHVGKYRILEVPTKLQFTWGIEQISDNDSIVTIEIYDKGLSSLVKLQHEMQPEWAEYLDRTRQAWEQMINILKTTLENHD